MNNTFWGDWRDAFRALQAHEGTWWVVTPFLTRVDVVPDPANTCVLTTLPAHKLATNDVQRAADERTLDALAALLDRGAKVRLLDGLHAKVYLRRSATAAVGFQGSANLTTQALKNKEVMSGLITFGPEFLAELDAFWGSADCLTHERLAQAREEARLAREQLPAFAGLVPEVVVFVLDREYGLGSFALTHRRLHLPENERENGYSPARVDFIHKDRTREMTNIISRGLARLLKSTPAAPAPALWLSNTTNMFAARREDAPQIRKALLNIQEELQEAAQALARNNPELLDDFLARLWAWMDSHQVVPALRKDIEAEARDAYQKVILGGSVQLRYTELVAHWPEEAHPWRPLFEQLLDQSQVRLLDDVLHANQVPS